MKVWVNITKINSVSQAFRVACCKRSDSGVRLTSLCAVPTIWTPGTGYFQGGGGGGGGGGRKLKKKKTVPVPWNPKLTLPRPLKPSEYKLNRFDIFPSQNKPHQNGVWKNKPTPKFLKTLRFQLMIRYLNFKRFILGRDSRTNQSKGIIFVNLSSGPRIISENESVVLFLLFKTKVKGNDVLTNLETGWLGTKNCSSTNCANL